ncbi:MAG: hypothetical protein WC694_00935 [Candidatus Paceibacterota bacterium]|jgi:hypothetical protein
MSEQNTQIEEVESSRIKTGTQKGTVEETKVNFNQDEAWTLLDNRTKNLEKTADRVEKRIDKVEDKIRDSNLNTIETLAIFVALFTFVSIEFQIFRSFSSWEAAASLSLILLGTLTFFVVLIVSLIDKKFNPSMFLKCMIGLTILGGVALFGQSKIIDSDYILKQELEENFYTQHQTDSQWTDFKTCIWYRGLNNCLK